MNIAIFLSIREKATRFPKKVLKEIKGKTVTELLIERLKYSKNTDEIVLTTSTHKDDKVLIELAEKCGIKHFAGSEDDKLNRYLEACEAFNVDFCVIVDGDDNLISTEYIDEVICEYKTNNYDYVYVEGLPLGMNSSGMTYKALKKVCELKAENNTEVWGGYFKDYNLFNIADIKVSDKYYRPNYRLTLDYYEDFLVFEKIFNSLYKDSYVTTEEIINYLDNNPDVVALNQNAQKLYEEHLKKSTFVKFKNNGDDDK